jgi:hypothetical protein
MTKDEMANRKQTVILHILPKKGYFLVYFSRLKANYIHSLLASRFHGKKIPKKISKQFLKKSYAQTIVFVEKLGAP